MCKTCMMVSGNDGCHFSPGPFGCLRCPLPECAWVTPEGMTAAEAASARLRERTNARYADIRALRASGLAPREIGQRVGLHERTVFHALAQTTHPHD